MFHKLDTVCDEVEHIVVLVLYILLHSQCSSALIPQPSSHLIEQSQILRNSAVPPRARLPRFSRGLDLLAGLVAHVGVAQLYEAHRQCMQLREVVTAVCHLCRGPTQPRDNVLYVVDELLLLGLGVGVVEAQDALPPVLRRASKVHEAGLAVAHVEVTVGLGREAGADAAPRGSEVPLQLLCRVGHVHAAPLVTEVHRRVHPIVGFRTWQESKGVAVAPGLLRFCRL
mmetsp:Transcript_551/g.1642  ORF Transcript_551/g.1642 Transcript_551/m.1642 type:complete len:227 (-) Transcript_551:813-1493(-)